jgi:hypothetical protein
MGPDLAGVSTNDFCDFPFVSPTDRLTGPVTVPLHLQPVRVERERHPLAREGPRHAWFTVHVATASEGHGVTMSPYILKSFGHGVESAMLCAFTGDRALVLPSSSEVANVFFSINRQPQNEKLVFQMPANAVSFEGSIKVGLECLFFFYHISSV